MDKLKLLFDIIIISSLLTSCGQTDSVVVSENQNTEVEHESIEIDSPEEDQEDSNYWKQIYFDYLAQPDDYGYSFFKNFEYTPYALAYINDDDIPELIAYGNTHAAGTKIFTIIDNSVLEHTFYSSVSYLEKKNLLYSSDGGMGYFWDEVYTLNSDWESVFRGDYNEWDKEDHSLTYYLQEQEVTETEYQKALNDTFDTSIAKDPEFTMDDKELIIYLTGDEDLAESELSKRIINISIDGIGQFVEWEENESVEALKNLLIKKGSITIDMSMYGDFEQVGSLGETIENSDTRITTEPGDIVLYNGDQIVVFYGSNTWAYTKLGKLKTPEENLNEMLSNGNVQLTLSISN